MQQTTGCSLMRFFTDIERESLGVICPRVLATGTSYTSALTRAKSGVFDRIFKLLASDADNEYMMIDASIVRAHQHSAGARKKRRASDRPIARRTDDQEIHALVDAMGDPVELMLTPGQDHDLTCAEPLIENADRGSLLLAIKLMTPIHSSKLSPSVKSLRSFRPRPTETSSGNATSHSIVNAI